MLSSEYYLEQKRIWNAVSRLELEKAYWDEKDLAEEAGISVEDAKVFIEQANL